ncbi:MAG: EthD family reductase [Chloroflexota bacterium]|nr:EthD family reductase [Chloroflexota bacterium]
MIQLTVLYGQPQDPAAFDRYYRETHVHVARKMPGIKGYTTNKPVSLNPQEPSSYYLIADLYFENMPALQAALQSPEGQAAAGDVQNFATGGAQLLVGEIQVYDPVSIGA